MSEQFVFGFAVDREALFGLVGSKDAKIVARAMRKRAKVEELEDVLGDDGLEVQGVLDAIVSGSLDVANARGYRRVLELLAPTVGKALTPYDAVLPGRGWQDVPLAKWGLRALAKTWGTCTFPWTKKARGASFHWPLATIVPHADLASVVREVAAFRVTKAKLPVRQRGCEEDFAAFIETIGAWATKARSAKSDLLLLHDGQQ